MTEPRGDGVRPQTAESAPAAAGAPPRRGNGWLVASPLVGLVVAAPALYSLAADAAPVAAHLIAWGLASGIAGGVAGALRRGPAGSWWSEPGIALLIASLPLLAMTALLKEATHHRPLGAATIAVAGTALIFASWIVVHRVHRGLLAWGTPLARVLRRGLGAVALLVGGGLLLFALAAEQGNVRSLALHCVLLVGGALGLGLWPATTPRLTLTERRWPAVAAVALPGVVGLLAAALHPAAAAVAGRALPWLALLGMG